MKLYELPAAFAEVEMMLVDGELTEEAMAKLAALEGTLEEKVQSCLCVAKNFAARAVIRKREADRMYDLAKSDEGNLKRLMDYVQFVMEKLDYERIETDLFKVRIQANPPSVVIDELLDLAHIPAEWVKTTIAPDRKAILAAAKSGDPLVEGITIVQTKSLRVS